MPSREEKNAPIRKLIKEQIEEYIFSEAPGKTRGAETTIAYHGTSSTHLRSIIQNGITPNPKDKVWNQDPDAGPHTISRISLKGTYWTTNVMTAFGSAGRSVKKFGGDRIIVIAQIVLRSTYADEDSIVGGLQNSITKALASVFGTSSIDRYTYFIGAMEQDPNVRKEAEQKFAENFHEYYKGSEQHPEPTSLLNKVFEAELMRVASYYFNRDEYYSRRGYIDGRERFYQGDDYESLRNELKDWKPDAQWLDSNYWEYTLSALMEKLTRQYRKTALDTDDLLHTFRSNLNIGIRGKNKIIAIVKVGFGDNIKVLYGDKSNIPDEFVREYRNNINREAIVESNSRQKKKTSTIINENMKQITPNLKIIVQIPNSFLMFVKIQDEDEDNIAEIEMAKSSDSGCNNAWEIIMSKADSGYGPLVYDIAMEISGDAGIMSDREVTSSSARNVWKYYFHKRKDITKQPVEYDCEVSQKTPMDELNYIYFKKDKTIVNQLKANGQLKVIKGTPNKKKTNRNLAPSYMEYDLY